MEKRRRGATTALVTCPVKDCPLGTNRTRFPGVPACSSQYGEECRQELLMLGSTEIAGLTPRRKPGIMRAIGGRIASFVKRG